MVRFILQYIIVKKTICNQQFYIQISLCLSSNMKYIIPYINHSKLVVIKNLKKVWLFIYNLLFTCFNSDKILGCL